MNEQYLDIDGQPQFTVGRAGERPYAPDIPTPYNPDAPTSAPEMGLRERLMRALFSGGATDVRNMASAVAPAGFQMALARAANPTAQLVKQGASGAYDVADQMFDMAGHTPTRLPRVPPAAPSSLEELVAAARARFPNAGQAAVGAAGAAGAGAASAMGQAPPGVNQPLEFTQQGQLAMQQWLAERERQRQAQIEAAQRAAGERVNQGVRNWLGR